MPSACERAAELQAASKVNPEQYYATWSSDSSNASVVLQSHTRIPDLGSQPVAATRQGGLATTTSNLTKSSKTTCTATSKVAHTPHPAVPHIINTNSTESTLAIVNRSTGSISEADSVTQGTTNPAIEDITAEEDAESPVIMSIRL